ALPMYTRRQLTLDGDEAALVRDHAGRLCADALTVRRATDCDQHLVVELRFDALAGRAFGRLEMNAKALLLRLDLRDFRLHHDALVALRDAPLERTHEIAIAAGNEPVRELDDAHLHYERQIDGRHLVATEAAADDTTAHRT